MSTDPEKFGRILPRELAQFTIRLERAETELEIEQMRKGDGAIPGRRRCDR